MSEPEDGQAVEALVAYLRSLVQGIVDYPDAVRVNALGHHAIVLELTVHPSDVGKAIGKKGSNAFAMRALCGAAAGRLKLRLGALLIPQGDRH